MLRGIINAPLRACSWRRVVSRQQLPCLARSLPIPGGKIYSTSSTCLLSSKETNIQPRRDPSMRQYMFWNREDSTTCEKGKYSYLIEFSPESVKTAATTGRFRGRLGDLSVKRLFGRCRLVQKFQNDIISRRISWLGRRRPALVLFSTKSSPPSSRNDDTDLPHTSSATSDPPIWTWVDGFLPSGWKPYARLARMDKPIGTWLLLWPCCWSTALAHPASLIDHVALVALFGIGAFTMRGAGCTINDLWDQDIDQRVERTQQRPLAAGELTTRQAIQFLAIQMATGCAVLVSLPHTWYCVKWGAASLPLVFLYPATKRFFPYPQLVLGLCFNWGAWMGWAATYGNMDLMTVAPLYFSGVTWTLVYDTIYAHQDKRDDKKLGLQSTALTFGSDETVQRRILHGLAASTLLLWAMAGYQADMVNPGLFGAGITAAYAHLVWQIQTADLDNPHNLAVRFRSNATTGALVYGALLAGHPPSTLW